jgi:acetyl-CoA C-acetyltransferase
METLARLRPVFKKDGTVTAGNASGINDGASALVIASRAKAEELDLPVMATIKGFTTRGCDPAIMGYGPIESTRALMERYGLSIDDFDLAESNEAFAVQSVLVLRELGLDPARVNVNGGAIALGHPIGESGSRILVTLLHEIARRKLFRGLATMCIGGGQGISAYLEREE